MTEFCCDLCQMDYMSEIAFLKHLETHSKKEVEILRKIALKKMNMTEKQEREFNRNLAVKLSRGENLE